MALLFTSAKSAALASSLALFSLITSAETNPSQPPVLGKLVDVRGHRVHIYCTGTGNPTVIVAGGGFSFDWGLVQPEVAKFTRVCTYDPPGAAWSDKVEPEAHPNCTSRVEELTELLRNAGIGGPYVLVGFSIGGLVVRLYADRYASDVAGMVLVDHAFLDTGGSPPSTAPGSISKAGLDSPPVLISKTPIALDIEDDQNFSRLPERDRELHRWALSIHSVRPTVEMAAECFSEVGQPSAYPLANKPLAVVSTLYDSPRYVEFQNKLLALSHNSEQLVAKNSSHMVIIDQPEIVVRAIWDVVAAARRGASLEK
ncbi:MAG: alpha/beta hydrolase [Bryobacteraceae bacterium]